MELPTTLVAPTTAGAMQLDETPPTQEEVAAVVTGGPQPEATVVAPEAAVRPAPPVTQVTVSDVG